MTDTASSQSVIEQAMRHALVLAARGPAKGANPQVGCVILSPDNEVIAEGCIAESELRTPRSTHCHNLAPASRTERPPSSPSNPATTTAAPDRAARRSSMPVLLAFSTPSPTRIRQPKAVPQSFARLESR